MPVRVALSIIGLLLVPTALAKPLPLHTGDIDADGSRTVADILCLVEASVSPDPDCQAFDDSDVDLDCNGFLDVIDVQRAILLLLWDTTEAPDIGDLLAVDDLDGDLVHDACDNDKDGDGYADVCEAYAETSPIDATETPDLGPTCEGLVPCATGTVCCLEGEVGDVVVCPLYLARLKNSTPLPAALQFTLHYDVQSLKLSKFTDDTVAPDGDVIEVAVPPDTLYPTNHEVAIVPNPLSSWSGSGMVAVTNPLEPTVGVTDTYLSDSGMPMASLEQAHFIDLHVQIIDTASPCEASYCIGVSNILATPAAGGLFGFVYDSPDEGASANIMVVTTYEDYCTASPAICNDVNPCTIDTCDTLTGQCHFAQDTELCDDGDPCTTDSCHPATGCEYAPACP